MNTFGHYIGFPPPSSGLKLRSVRNSGNERRAANARSSERSILLTALHGSFINYVTRDKGGGSGETRENFERDAVRERAKWNVTPGQNTLKVGKKQHDAAKSEKSGA